MNGRDYRKRLIDAGIALSEAQDELKWTGGDCTGILSTRNVYNAWQLKIWQKNIGGWQRRIWNWDCPQKIKLFSWLLIEDKLLTWNNLNKRGWQGPGLCLLCRGNEESVFIYLSNALSLVLFGKKI
jgi:hypothetical protein